MSTKLVELRVDQGVAILTLNRPEKRNAINDALRGEFVDALEQISTEGTARALILTGQGKVFCAGGDVSAMHERLQTDPGEVAFAGWTRQQHTHHAQSLLADLPIPTIAAVNGPAAGLGADLAMACDFVMAATEASFAWSYIHRGLIADGGGLHFLPRRVGLARAKELIFTGRRVTSDEALGLGIVDRLATAETLIGNAVAWALELGHGSRVALAFDKGLLNKSSELSREEIFAQGSQAQSICYTSSEHRRSVAEFVAKNAVRHAGDAR